MADRQAAGGLGEAVIGLLLPLPPALCTCLPQIEARNLEALLLAQEAYEELVARKHIPSQAHSV